MQASTLHSTYQSPAAQNRSSMAGFFTTHLILPVLRGLFLYCLLWISLAFALYGVYSLIVGTS